jgi:tetratricopeptide (TPR) repeat protein
MRKTDVRRLLLSCGVVLALTAAAWADSVWVAGPDNKPADKGIPYKGKIEDIKTVGGQVSLVLIWETSNQPKASPMMRVRRVAVDDVPELGVADATYAEGKYAEAIRLYGALQGKSSKPWIGPYVTFRLVDCYGQTKQFARSAKVLVDLCRTNSPLAEAVRLPAVPAKGSADNAAATKTLLEALAATPPVAYAEKLKRLRNNILKVEGDPAEVLKVVEEDLKNPDEELRSQARITQIELLLKVNKLDEMAKSIAQGRKELDAEYGPQLYYYEGRMLYERKDFLHAALAFMRTPIGYSMSNKALAADCLVWAAKSMQEGQAPKAEVLIPLREAVEKFPGTDGAAQAQKMLKELGP